jgi:hypothetical protein
MNREDLEHIIRAAASVTDQYEFIIVGSQSILGSVPNPKPVFTMSAEADIYPLQAPELAEKSTAHSGKVRNSMTQTGTTHKALAPIPPSCLTAGRIASTGFRTLPRMAVSATA